MKLPILLSLLLFFSTLGFAQINMEDSTVQVIGYWDKNEQQSYLVKEEIIRVKDTDTLYREVLKYAIDIKILDSTANSYTVEWAYRDFETDTKNYIKKRLAAIAHSQKVVIRTDEYGAFTSVLNGKDLQNQMDKALKELKKGFKISAEENELMKRFELTYANKEALEASFANDIQQYYTFHGGKYTLGELLEGQMKVANILGGDPFDSDLTVSLDEINEEDNDFVLRSGHAVNSAQLTQATYNYLVSAAKRMGTSPPNRNDIKDLTNELLISARIHGSGWVLYSVHTKTVTSDNITNIEERTLELE